MSATGRGERGGGGHDFFPTPPAAVRSLLAACQLPGGRWLEPSAGDGAIIRAVNAMRADVEWTAAEIREEARGPLNRLVRPASLHIGDFLSMGHIGGFDVALGNPPFCLADRFIGACLERARVVAFLLRLNILGSLKRFRLWQRHPADVYVLADRPSFTEDGGTDMAEYAWFVWGQCGTYGKVQVLGPPVTADLFDTRTQSPA